jgi:dihydrolipoamide dehydrogenase
VSGHIALVAVGEREARHAVISMFANFTYEPIKYKIISTIMFLNPEVASVGINEQIAEHKGIPVRVAKVNYGTITRAIAMRKTNGFFKLIVSDDDEMKVLGMRAIGEHASSAIQALSLLVYMNKGILELSTMVYPHPSIIEGIQTCCRLLLGKALYKPDILTDKVQCYRLINGHKINIRNMGHQ